MTRRVTSKSALACLLGLAAAGALSACETRQEARGYRFDEDRIALIKVGASSQDDVQQTLGSPSSVSTFAERNNSWYYIASNTEQYAFLKETTVAQRVVVIDFDEAGKVTQVRQYGLQDGRDISPISRETPTRGKELGLFEQFFGNLGRFNKQARPPGS